MKQRTAAIKIQRVFRGHMARLKTKKRRHLIVWMQCCIRRRLARKELKALRMEARSLEKYKEVSYKLENKVVELTQVLDEEKTRSKQLQTKTDSMQEELGSMRHKVETYKPYKEMYETLLAQKAELERQIEEILQTALKEKADLVKKVSDRDTILHQKEAEYEKMKAQLEAEKKHLKELHDTLKQTHQALLAEVTKDRQEWTEKGTQQNERLQRLQTELDRAGKELQLEKKKSEGLTATVERLQNDTSALDGMRKVLGDQQQEMERQTQLHTEELEQKVEALKEAEEERIKLSKELRVRDEKIAQKDIEFTKASEQLDLAKREIARLLELTETINLEKAKLASLKSEADSLRDSLVAAQTELKKTNKQLQEANEELKVNMANELAELEDQLKRKGDDYEQLRKALANEERESAALREKIIRLETLTEASAQTNDLKNSITTSLEESNAELKKLNMSLMESNLKTREELSQKLDNKDQKLEQKEQQIRDLTLEIERERREVQRLKDVSDAGRREADLKAESASLKASMGLQEIQLQLKMQQQQIDQQQSLIQESSKKSNSSLEEVSTLQTRLLKESQNSERFAHQLENLKKDHEIEMRTLKEMMAIKTAEAERAERRRLEEVALLEAKFEEERRSYSKLVRKAAREGNLALGDPSSPDEKVTSVPPIRQKSKDWVVLHKDDDAPSALGGDFEKELTSRLITRLRIPVFAVGEKPASPNEVLYPAHLIGIAMGRMLDLGMEQEVQSLLVSSLRALNTLAQQKKDDKVALLFWLGNATELRNVVYSLVCVDANGREVSQISKPVSKLLNDLGHMVTETFHTIVQKVKEQLSKVVPAAIVMFDKGPASGFFFFSTKIPGPDQITQVLTEVNALCAAYQVHTHTSHHLFSRVLYMICTESFNHLLLKKELCTGKRGTAIRANLAVLEEWCTSNGYPEAVLHFKPLSEILFFFFSLSFQVVLMILFCASSPSRNVTSENAQERGRRGGAP